MAKPKSPTRTPTPTKAKPTAASIESKQVSPDQIRVRAHQIYESRHGAPGNPVMDWIEAEHQLEGELGSTKAR